MGADERNVLDELGQAHEAAEMPGTGTFTGYGAPLVVLDLEAFLAKPIPPRQPLLAPILAEQSLAMIHAWRGVGKTHVALGIAYAVASGGTFLGWKAEGPRKVLYLDGEMPAGAMQERFAAIVKANEQEAPKDYLRLVTSDMQPGAMPDLTSPEGQAAVDAIVEPDTALIVVDNLSALARGGKAENDAESWLPIAGWALKHRARRRAILFIHHSGKGGLQRGTSKREDLLDLVLALKNPKDYDPRDGAVFGVHFEKARGLCGKDVEPFEAKLSQDANGGQTWTTRAVADSAYERVIQLHDLGLNQIEIAKELEVNKSTVCRAIQRAEKEGRITRKGSRT